MPLEPHKFYKPVNKLRFLATPVTELSVSGSVTTEAHISRGWEISGSVSSQNVCKGYDIVISYDGPVDIGDRNIIKNRIGNYWKSGQLAQKASQATGITNAYTGWHKLATCMSVITCIYCCTINCIGDSVNSRQKRLDDKLDELANAKMSEEIAGMLKEADELVSERIKHKKESQQAPIGAGNVVLTEAQFQALLKGSQARPALETSANDDGAGPAITTQYKKDKKKSRKSEDSSPEEVSASKGKKTKQKALEAL